MLPHEKELVERLKNEPFALLGVNTDRDKDEYREKAAKYGVTWRSVWTGGGGPIPELYAVEGYPTLYLIDHEGVIREKWVGNPGAATIDRRVAQLVSAAKRALAEKEHAERGAGGAGDGGSGGPGGPTSDVDALDALDGEFQQAQDAWRTTPSAERGAHPARAFYERYRALADAGEGRAMLWIATWAQDALDDAAVAEAKRRWFGRLVEEHAGAPWFGERAGVFRSQARYVGEDEVASLLRRWLEQGPHESAVPTVLHALGSLLFASDDEATRADGRAVLGRLIEQYPEHDLASRAQGALFRADRLQVGMVVPDFTTEDVDGVELRFSDYRGKVVLLDFWGFW